MIHHVVKAPMSKITPTTAPMIVVSSGVIEWDRRVIEREVRVNDTACSVAVICLNMLTIGESIRAIGASSELIIKKHSVIVTA